MAFSRFGIWPVLLLLLLCVSPGAAMSLSDAEKALLSENKSKRFQAYDTFKSSYMTATISGDKARMHRALDGIIKSGKLLHIDVSDYVNKQKASSQPAGSVKRSGSVKKPRVRARNQLKDVKWEAGKLVLIFDTTLGRNDVNYFKLKKTDSKGYRYVFDIHGALPHAYTLTHKDLKRLRLSQYKPSTLRLVMESTSPRSVRFSLSNKKLTVNAGLSSITSPKTTPYPAIVSSKRNVVVIDPGHGGKDPGAIGYKKYREKEIVFGIAKKTADRLRALGYTVYLTRSKDTFIKLRNRTHFANKKRADLFISIHANAVPKKKAKDVHGIETYFLSPSRSKRATNAAAKENSTEMEDMNFYGKNTFLNALNSEKIVASHKLAIDLQSSVLSSLRAKYDNVKDAGVREGPFWVLVGAQMPAVLVEVGFLTHPMEAARLKTKTYQDYFARGLVEGIERYFAKNP